MDACHLLLGRPWQYDRRAQYDGYTNTYSFTKDGVKVKLAPLPPKEPSHGEKKTTLIVSLATKNDYKVPKASACPS